MTCLEQLQELKKNNKAKLSVLIDPDKAESKSLAARMEQSVRADILFTLLGGSFITQFELRQLCNQIRLLNPAPIVLFPSNGFQLTDTADAVLFLSLISGRNPDYLIGRHLEAAPLLQKMTLEIMPTGYLLIDGGRPTSATYISQTFPLPNNKPEIATYTALAGQYLGLKLIYLDCGSGADIHASNDMVEMISQTLSIPLVVGGGIKTPKHAEALSKAGANLLVIGTALEQFPHSNLLTEIAAAIA